MNQKIGKLYVCSARVELRVSGALTLKDRRAVVRSIMERLKSRFNLSVSDLDGGERGASFAVIGLAAAANEMGVAREAVEKAVEFIAGDGRVEMGEVDLAEL